MRSVLLRRADGNETDLGRGDTGEIRPSEITPGAAGHGRIGAVFDLEVEMETMNPRDREPVAILTGATDWGGGSGNGHVLLTSLQQSESDPETLVGSTRRRD